MNQFQSKCKIIPALWLFLLFSPAHADELSGPYPDPGITTLDSDKAIIPDEETITAPVGPETNIEPVIQPEYPEIISTDIIDNPEPEGMVEKQAETVPEVTNYLVPEEQTLFAEQTTLEILGEFVEPGQKRELSWSAGQSFSGRSVDPPVLVVRGTRPGPSLCLTAAIHGDELNGIEIVRRVIANLDPAVVSGTVIGVPIVNIYGFTNGSRYLPDRRDLNRYFPGKTHGSSASRIAYLFFNQIVKHCNLLVDFHTGSFKRINLPQLRADLNDPYVMEFVRHFGSTAILHKSGVPGNLRTAATRAGIPAVTFELGQPGFLQPQDVDFGVKAIETLLGKLGLLKRYYLWFKPQPVYYGSRWVRANHGGILRTATEIGASIRENDLLGYIINPLTSEETEIRSPANGRVLGMALNQFMLPGYAAFHIGIVTNEPVANAGFRLVPSKEPDNDKDFYETADNASAKPADDNYIEDTEDEEIH